jgi:glycine reductase
MGKLKALCYINQFYAGLGGEEMAHEGLHVFEGAKGPAIGMSALWKDEMEVVRTLSCGDNFINLEENYESIKPQLLELVKEMAPDVVIAGPAFNAGRYGVACGKFCDLITSELGIPSVTSMFPTNPAVEMYLRKTVIAEGAETAAGMRTTLPNLAKLALKLAKKEALAPAAADGYIPTGIRINEVDDKSAAERVVECLLKKIQGKPFATEVPLRKEERVSAAPPVSDSSSLRFALVTTGGLVPKGNPDKLRQYASVSYGTYPINLPTFNKEHYESVHGGYDTTAVNNDPQRLIPYTAALNLQKRGIIGSVTPYFLSTCGIGTNVAMGKKLGSEMAAQLIADGVQAVFLTST